MEQCRSNYGDYMNIAVVVLAAGYGTRMKSRIPKVLHQLAGKPLLEHILSLSSRLSSKQTIVVTGHKGYEVIQSFKDWTIDWIQQVVQRGTGDALKVAMPHIKSVDHILVLYGDVPLIQFNILNQFVQSVPKDALGLLTTHVSRPHGLGRIIRNDTGHIIAIVEEKDATPEQKQISEINPGIYMIPYSKIGKWLSELTATNEQQELYLTDFIANAVRDCVCIVSRPISFPNEVQGINNRVQLANAERAYQQCQAKHLMLSGVTLYDPMRFDVRGKVKIDPDVTIDVNVILEGEVTIESGVTIGHNTQIKNSTICTGTKILSNCVIDSAKIGMRFQIGPFARIRPGSHLHTQAQIGNFVEVKKTVVGQGSIANHLSYLGDAEIGKGVNIGAGTITCNYDGANKHKTIIEDDVFIGSDTQLIAPVSIGRGASIAAGTTVMKDVSPNQLALNKKKQQHVENWDKPKKKAFSKKDTKYKF